MEVKMFIHKDPAAAESGVNAWLQEHPVHVCHVTQSQCELGGRLTLIVSIFYTRAAVQVPQLYMQANC